MHGWRLFFEELGSVWDRYNEGSIPASVRDGLRATILNKWKRINAGLDPLPEENQA